MRTFPATMIILVIALSSACKNVRKQDNKKTQYSNQEVYAREPDDSADYRHIRYDFYISKTGQLCERKLAMARDSTCNCEFVVYYDSIFTAFTGHTTILKPLSSIVDIDSFAWVDSTDFSKDKNHVYYFFSNSDGGIRSIIEGADPKTFRRLCEYRWGIDRNFVYYQNKKLEGLDLKKLQVLYSPDGQDSFVDYIKDDSIVYQGDRILRGADAKTFRTVSGQKWNAEDKNSRYMEYQ